jgi:hypothetical protein
VERGGGSLPGNSGKWGLAKGHGGRWVVARKAGEGKFKENRSEVSDLFGDRFASESLFSPELEHGIADVGIWLSPKNCLIGALC